MTIAEFDRVQQLQTPDGLTSITQEEYICQRAVLHPDLSFFEDKSAGLLATLAAEIVNGSGFNDLEKFEAALEKARENSGKVIDQAILYIHMAFPHYSLDAIGDWNIQTLMTHLALAEQVLGQQFTLGQPGSHPGAGQLPAGAGMA